MTPIPKIAWAAGCSDRGKVSKRTDWALARRPPPASPWRMRATTSIGRLAAIPQRAEAAVKPMSEKSRYCFLPKRLLSQAVRGMMTTFAQA